MGKHRKNPSRPEPDYDVGYRVPPEKGKFKPGQSGNPKGRPRRRNTIGEDRDLLLHEPITMTELDGRRRKRTRQYMILRTMSALAMKGDVRAARFMFDLDRRHQSEDPSAAEPDNDLTAEDRALLADYMRRSSSDDEQEPPEDGDKRGGAPEGTGDE